jgi:membrane-associated protein
MTYSRYILFCVVGALLWVPTLTMLGFFFGNLPIVKQNFELVIFGIIGLSVLPMAWQFVKVKFMRPK